MRVVDLLIVCGFLGLTACGRQTPSDQVGTAPRESITAINCTPEQKRALEDALTGICKAVARPDSSCQKILAQHGALESFTRQCGRGLRVRCREALCGQYIPKRLAFYTDDGTIEMGLGGLAGGKGCGGYEKPMEGPAHTLTHEMAHAARLVSDGLAERVAYACRGDR